MSTATDSTKPIRVTAEDLETGDKRSVEVMDDYVILAAGSCYVAHTQAHANGTHVVTIKGRKP